MAGAGLPRDVFNFCRYHLDITKRGISLETCTAIGVIPTVIETYVEMFFSSSVPSGGV